ncbi:hypothetical protein F4805DRAFT_64301 [Annulohypoxylon moriforme]|nr:hypothetical protein F4805DRAFT_64301 [Annulohypoxylon moriforme]
MRFNSTNIPPEILAALPAEIQAQAPLYDQTEGPKIYATMTVCTVITYTALGLRLYARRLTKQPLGLDDLFTSLTAFSTTISVGLLAYLTKLGVGRHEIVMILEQFEDFDALIRTTIAATAIYFVNGFCVKASAIFLYRRIFPNKRFRIVNYIILSFIALFFLIAILVFLTSCLTPARSQREGVMASLKCSNDYLINTLLVILSVNVALDAIVLCLPLPLIWRLQTNLRRKLQLTLVFTLGSFIFAISILRVTTVKQFDPSDDNWGSVNLVLWSIAESALGVVTVSLPVMQPALRRAMYHKNGSSRITLSPKSNNPNQDQNQNNNGNSPPSLLTFGRSGMKGPRGRNPRKLDMSTITTTVIADASSDGSATMLVSEDRGSHDTEHANLRGGDEESNI